MPTRYMERLHLPLIPTDGMADIKFTTQNGLPIAHGYNCVVLTDKGPMVEFHEDQVIFGNICIPPALQWRKKHPEAFYAEYRSRDYCSVKVFEQRRTVGKLLERMWYISPFDLSSDRFPVLIEKLKKKKND